MWVGHFARHLELDWDNPVWQPWLSVLSRRNTLIRYDLRGCGLSDRDVADITSERLQEDFEAVVAATSIQTFAFMGTAGNVAVGVGFAVRNPNRVNRLVLYGCHTQGMLKRSRSEAALVEAEARLKIYEMAWLKNDSPFGQFITAVHTPDARPGQLQPFGDLLRQTTTPQTAARIIRSYWNLDLREQLQHLVVPTMVIHCSEDPVIPFEEGRLAASCVPNARFVPIYSRNHILLNTEPGWPRFISALEEFLSAATEPAKAIFHDLTAREREVLEIIAQGKTNKEVAAFLKISDKTVRNHVSSIFSKIGVNSRAQAVAIARDNGFGTRKLT